MISVLEVAPGVTAVCGFFVNLYLVETSSGRWVLVDTGMPTEHDAVHRVINERLGGRAPSCIVLTHGHIDHSGSARRFSEEWHVPIYAHRLELPFLTGRSDYPPPDPTVGGFHAQMCRFMPYRAQQLGSRLRTLPGSEESDEGTLDELPGWRWLFTPGHSPGHISLFRERDRVLIAGDAVATANLDSWTGATLKTKQLWRAGTPFTCNWTQAERSARRLAELAPAVICAGHGLPLSGVEAEGLDRFAKQYPRPSHGRYVDSPAVVDENGVQALPPRPFDPVPAVAGIVASGVLLNLLTRRGEKRLPQARRAVPRLNS